MHRLTKTIGSIMLLLLLILPMPVQAITPTVYESEQQAMESELAHLRETVTEPGLYTFTLRFYNNGVVVEKVITLEITSDDLIAANGISGADASVAFNKNSGNGWYETYEATSIMSWSGFVNITMQVLQVIILLVLLFPFLLLLVQYFLTSKLMKQVNEILD